MEEQVNDTTIPTESTGAVDTVENKPTDETPRTYTQEEYDKAIKSSSGKAKNEILKELGISSVKDFATLKQSYEEAIKSTEELSSANDALKKKLVLKDLNIRDDVSDDFISLANKRITDDKTFEDAAKEVAELYPNMVREYTATKNVKLGNEKKDGSKKEPEYSEELLKRFPFLANNKKI